MNQDERASQLSAMFDGELPAAECELLSRRLVRDEQLRATWSRYAVIGAALRAEPVARVRPDFARRVSAALVAGTARAGVRRGRFLRHAAFGTAVAAGVAGVAIMLLRNGLPVQEATSTAYVPAGRNAAAAAPAASTVVALRPAGPLSLPMNGAGNELASYVVPPAGGGNNLAVPASLADYVVAHSEVSSPLARRSLLSALIGNEAVLVAPVEGGAPVPERAASAGDALVDGRR